MPAGCEFICKNKACEYCDTGFNISAPWPMGRIELVINAANEDRNPEFKAGLIKLKDEGRKYACITYPNYSDIKTEAYRVHMWSKDNNMLHQYDVEALTVEALEEQIPDRCPISGGEMLSFDEITKQGIFCPHCNIPLTQNRWFTNED